MTYSVKEIFYSLQGEGARTGRASVFCRFSGCNLWSGLERDRATAQCNFCDTDFIGVDGIGGGKFTTADALADEIDSYWPKSAQGVPYVVFTGGEPLLQLDSNLIEKLKAKGFEVAVETNGTLPAPEGIDWLCVSPKGKTQLLIYKGDELKLVYPQTDALPERFAELDFPHFYLQPMESEQTEQNTAATMAYILANPQWRLSLQTHKMLAIR
ncbi:MAG: 7-carboxy-7-deazaguanine synthase [Saprospiraceae bacterium]|jgi:7-carboxy-7-deazaguanine synthase